MKILVVLSNPCIGGTETFVASLVPSLKKLGVETDVLNIWRDSEFKNLAREVQLSYRELNSKSRYISIGDVRQIIKTVIEKKYDVIIGFGIRVDMLLRTTRPFLRKTPVVIGLRGLDKWRKWYHVLPDRLTQFAVDIFVPVSDAVAKCRVRREKTSLSKIVVIKNGIDTDFFDKNKYTGTLRNRFGLSNDKVIITSVGNFRHQKGYDFFLDVIEELSRQFKDVHFAWAGIGGLQGELEERIKKTGLDKQVTILGRVNDICLLLACSDIYAMPSREEGMPRCLMEAMAMSLPAVATNVGGTSEVIENGRSGFLCEFGDVQGFGSNLKKLIENSDLRSEIGQAARKRITQYFDMRIITAKYVKLFELLLSKQRDGRVIQRIVDS